MEGDRGPFRGSERGSSGRKAGKPSEAERGPAITLHPVRRRARAGKSAPPAQATKNSLDKTLDRASEPLLGDLNADDLTGGTHLALCG
jgi:hypothetical protein